MSQPHEIIPVLVYEDLAAAHDYLVGVFGFEPGGVFRDDDGTPRHAEVRAGERVIWMHRVTAEHRMASPRVLGPSEGGLVVYVDDVDAHHARALAAGARIDSAPVDQPYGQREYGATDLEGHRWWFATPAAAAVPESA